LVCRETATSLEVESRQLLGKLVYVDEEVGKVWEQQSILNPEVLLDEIGDNKALKSLVCSITGLEAINDQYTKAWINRYRLGDAVPQHTDADGDTQLVICLQETPFPKFGGEIFIEDASLPLTTGDAVIFEASRLPHGVSPYRGNCPQGLAYYRVTLVLRFYGLQAKW